MSTSDPWPDGHPLHGTPTHAPAEQAAPVHDEPDPNLPPVSDEPAAPESHNGDELAVPDDEEPVGWAPLDVMTDREVMEEILSIMRGLSDQVEAIKTQAEDNPMGLIQTLMSGGIGGIL